MPEPPRAPGRTASGLLDLALAPAAPRPPESGVQSVRRRGRLRLLLDLAALTVVLAGAGSLWHREHPETLAALLESPLLERLAGRTADGAPPEGVALAAAPLPLPVAPARVPVDAPPPAPPPVEPERPAAARLQVPAGWGPGLRLSIDGDAATRLDRALERDLEPGPHRLEFRLALPGYYAARTLEVDLAPGETRRVVCPIPRPGRITVQPHLGSPQGLVRLNGRVLERAADGRHPVAPGGHRLAVAALSRPDVDLVGLEVDVASGEEAVVTYDLTGRTAPVVHRRSPSGA